MFADCYRDFEIAEKYGFEGSFLGVYPGGGGIDFLPEKEITSLSERNIILVKGYQRLFGECIQVLQALKTIAGELKDFKIIVFGADREALKYIDREGIDS